MFFVFVKVSLLSFSSYVAHVMERNCVHGFVFVVTYSESLFSKLAFAARHHGRKFYFYFKELQAKYFLVKQNRKKGYFAIKRNPIRNPLKSHTSASFEQHELSMCPSVHLSICVTGSRSRRAPSSSRFQSVPNPFNRSSWIFFLDWTVVVLIRHQDHLTGHLSSQRRRRSYNPKEEAPGSIQILIPRIIFSSKRHGLE